MVTTHTNIRLFRLLRDVTRVVLFVWLAGLSAVAAAQSSPAFNHNSTGFILEGDHVTVACESCHTQGLFRGTPKDCATCHRPGDRAPGKPANHVPTNAKCDACHKDISWVPNTFRHTVAQGVVVGSCSTCHNGSNASGKPALHPVTSASCDSCHQTAAWLPAGFNHALATPGGCATCHNGVRATGKPATHMPTTASCDACHTPGVAFAPLAVSVSTMHAHMVGPVAAGNCSTCHSGSLLNQNAQTKPSTHIPTSSQCDSCHKSTTSWAIAAKPDHGSILPPVAGRCTDCHNNVTAIGKPANHVPTVRQCDTCHSYVAQFAPAQMNHIGTAGQCTSCHNGAFNYANALAKPNVHVPTTAQCDACHSSNFSAWAPGVMNHAASTGPQTAGNCSVCHSGAFLPMNAQVKPATHIKTAAQCDSCHKSTVSWATATFLHDATAINCSGCHNNVAATGKPGTHIPTSSQCSVCHNNTVSFIPATTNHPGTTGPAAPGNCATCHNGNYVIFNALAKPATHIPTASQCDTCHTKGYINWSPSVMNHTGLAGQCSTCHNGAYVSQNAQTKDATHLVTTAQCDSCHKSTTSWATASFNHATAVPAVAGRCSTCHNGTAALGKPSNHIPTTAQCDACHANFTAFAPGVTNHAATTGPVAAGNCATCHGGAFVAINAQVKTPTHIPTTQSCDACHTTSYWKPTTFAHVGILPGTCKTCHNGVNASGQAAVHIPTTQSCDACHKMGISWLPLVTPYSHAGVPATGCSSCHLASYPSIDVKPAAHLVTALSCENCHTSFASWLPAHFNHVGVAKGTCQTCHGGTYTGIVAKPSNHIPTTTPAGSAGNECSLCHSSTVSFVTERMNHGSMQTSCVTCHDSTSPYLGNMSKINRAHHNGAGIKDCSSSGCHRPLGSKGQPYSSWD
ncbi:hypothetical protein AAKU67_002263 [Oxalobacteraceae bacterium GrIS 2.11]